MLCAICTGGRNWTRFHILDEPIMIDAATGLRTVGFLEQPAGARRTQSKRPASP
jgi:hypothetical protein